MNKEHFLWVEKYRPQTIEECILPANLKAVFTGLRDKGEIINLLLSGGPGTGKTTVARALCEELKIDYIIINGSDEGRSIDILRDKIKKFASTVSFSSDKAKVVIIDEADYLGIAVQPALRNFIEEFSGNCRFILTCNYKHKIIQPLHSRCSVVDFNIDRSELPHLAGSLLGRVSDILNAESIEFDKLAAVEVIQRFFPDNRRVLNELQRYAQISGKIDAGVMSGVDSSKTQTLVKFMKDGNFKHVRQWIADNPDTDTVFSDLYENLDEYVVSDSKPSIILIMAEYQHKAAMVANQELNLAAACVELMKNVKWK